MGWLSLGTLIGQLLVVLLMLALAVVAIRLLWAVTRWVNRKADALERSMEQPVGEEDSGSYRAS